MSPQEAAEFEAKPVGRLGATLIYGRSILVDVAHRALRRRRRGAGQVAKDYDSGEWRQQSEAADWLRGDSLEHYVERAWVASELVCTIDGKLWKIPARQYYRYRRAVLTAIVGRFAGEADELVEVGSGTGFNLFTLFIEGRWRSLLGLELSATGREVARRTAEHFGIGDRVRFDEIDLTDPDSPGFDKLRGKTVLTYLCLEQLPNHTERVMRSLCRAGVKRVIHIEPSYELLRRGSLRDLASISYVWRQDYQRTIVSTARRLEAEGLLRVVAAERLHHSPTWRNAPTLVVWDSEGACADPLRG
jgi:hypothetical protein